MRVYATSEDLQEWTGVAPPSNAASLLRSASLLVESETGRAVYTTDSTGLPTDEVIRGAFRDATTAQAAFWADNKVNPTLGAAGLPQVVSGKSMGGGSISFAVDKEQLASRSTDLLSLQSEPFLILKSAGLITNAVQVH